MTNREKILSQPFKNVILDNTRYTVDDLKNINPICDFFTCLCCQFKNDKKCEKKMEEWLDKEVDDNA